MMAIRMKSGLSNSWLIIMKKSNICPYFAVQNFGVYSEDIFTK